MLLTFENVSLTYPPNRKVLDDVDFNLDDGGFYFLTGPSGAGKSSLLRLIYQAERPTSGRIYLFGEPLLGIGRNKQGSAAPQDRRGFSGFAPDPASHRLGKTRLCRYD